MDAASMILCKFNGSWFLSTGINWKKNKCWLRCGAMMPHPETFKPLPPIGAVLSGSVEGIEGVTFYPVLNYQNYEVWPQFWHRESAEPLLHCHIDANTLSIGTTNSTEFRQRVQELQALSWKYELREGCEKYVHVDELRKIEGPPPEGTF
ncbi:MAG TPA: hypothetical protein PKN33_17645 [Phycisphaerae bacterium]|nr:hypothetical protein [Phycisphaerae bacterium]